MNNLISSKTFNSQLFSKKVFSKGEKEKLIQTVAELDGAIQYWILSEGLNLYKGTVIKFKTFGVTDVPYVSDILFGDNGVDRGSRLYLDNFSGDGAVLRSRSSAIEATVDGLNIQYYPVDGEEHLVVGVVMADKFYLDSIGAINGGEDYFFPGAIYDLSISLPDGRTITLPLTNKNEGANQTSPDSNLKAFLVNFTAAVWRDKAQSK